jgi:hypothetical protein
VEASAHTLTCSTSKLETSQSTSPYREMPIDVNSRQPLLMMCIYVFHIAFGPNCADCVRLSFTVILLSATEAVSSRGLGLRQWS